MMKNDRHPASFRDPSGFLFERNGNLYRQINHVYQQNYDHLIQSGLYDLLVQQGHLVAHQEVDIQPEIPELCYKVIQPERLPFISYPYEWSFSQYKDAALQVLKIQQAALKRGMSLKDASAYNMQFNQGHPVLIDTLSFEKYQEGQPWVAYRQFCQHFLAPLALMALKDIRLSQLMRVYIDGIPLDLAAHLLPWQTRLQMGLGTHLFLHAEAQRRYADSEHAKRNITRQKMSQMAFLGLLDSLESTVQSLNWRAGGTAWADYYDFTNYQQAAFETKKTIVAKYLAQSEPKVVWDLGANTGVFSRLAPSQAIVLAFDIDPSAVEANYRQCRDEQNQQVLPLCMDLTNPSPALGWNHQERASLVDRGPADTILALALIHHLAIGNNLPFFEIAKFFARCCKWLIIEFVPKGDSQVQKMLASRLDIFPHYQQAEFEQDFGGFFEVIEKEAIQGSERTLYLMRRK